MSQRRFFKRVSSLLVGGSLCVAALAANGFSQNSVTLNVNGAVHKVQKQMYGALMERLGRQWAGNGSIFVGTSSSIPHINGMRKDVLDGLKECGLGSAQWPGGCAALNYNWNPPNPANEVGTDRFLEFCQYVGCEPLFAGPHATTSANSNLYWIKHIDSVTAQRGMDSLRWFKIGNEVWGGCASHVDSATYCTYFKVHHDKIHPYRKSVLLEAGNNNEDRGFNAVAMWQKTVVKTLDTLMDGLEYHDYVFRTWWPSDAITTAQYWRLMNDGLVGDFAGHMRTNVIPVLDSIDPNKRIKLIVDEWGDWLGNDGNWMQKAMLLDGLNAANHLHLMMGYADRITVACLAQGVNVIHSLININTAGQLTKTPTFYVFKMFKPHHERGAKWVPTTASTIQTFVQSADGGNVTLPVVNVGSTVDSVGRVNISVCNIDMSATRQITINLTSTVGQYVIDSAQVVTGATVTTSNPYGAAEVVNLQNFAATNYTLTNSGKTLSATLPAKSVVMFRLLPATVGVQTGGIQTLGSNAFSVKNGSNGSVLISSTVSKKTPVTISLYSVNGRTLLNKVSKTFEPGTSSFALKNGHYDNGVYIVKIVGEDVNLSQKVVVGK